MTTVTCDRCGEKIEDVNYDATTVRINEENIDLCQECQNKLNNIIQKFIRGEDVVVEALKKE
jgi:NAD-dependent SIR2 family protein deacetylase